MTQKNHLVSVIVPIYNMEAYLDQALASLEEQSFPNLEIICINDGSTDGSSAIMRAHAARDARIRIIDRENQGYGASCNLGIEEASGDYLAILEPDDWIERGMFADLLELADSLAVPVDVAKSAYWRVFERAGETIKVPCAYKQRVKPDMQPFRVADQPELLLHHPSIWSAIYRLEWLREKGIRFREVPGAGWVDNPFLVETLCQTDAIAYLDHAYYCYREDTAEKALAFAHRNPLLPLERWCDMVEILERLGVRDESVWRAQNLRGITYSCTAIEASGLDHPGLRDKIVEVFSAMDPALVMDDAHIKPAEKRLFATLLGLPEPQISAIAYLPELAKQALYRLRTAGPRFTWLSIVDYVKRRRARVGS